MDPILFDGRGEAFGDPGGGDGGFVRVVVEERAFGEAGGGDEGGGAGGVVAVAGEGG